MQLQYVKLDPSGNTTILILDPVPQHMQADIARRVMAERSLCAEQVGFCQPAGDSRALLHMRMAGGEFCGNASRSFAAWLALGGQETLGKAYALRPMPEGRRQIDIEVSGHDGILSVDVQGNGSENGCFAAVDMPLPLSIEHGSDGELGRYSMVCFAGITHLILPEAAPDEGLLPAARRLIAGRGVQSMDFGLMFLDAGNARMTPLVCIEEVQSQVWESSCGSGSVAAACAMAHAAGRDISGLTLRQPGGSLQVSAEVDGGRIRRARLAGDIAVSSYGTVLV